VPDYACLDVETTGLDASNCRILEIAVVLLDDDRVVHEWTTLVNPVIDEIGPTHIHGITQDDLIGAPAFAEVAGDLVQLLEGRVPVAHNASFDVGFLSAEWDNCFNFGPLGLTALDTLRLSRELGLPGKLSALAEAIGVDLTHAHQALDDTRALAEVLVILLARADVAGIAVEHPDPYFLPTIFGPSPSGRKKARPPLGV
tara:strand:+ start:656 stop:1255 length:600 start_codon:yes stop_codon:yes gene_type:complete